MSGQIDFQEIPELEQTHYQSLVRILERDADQITSGERSLFARQLYKATHGDTPINLNRYCVKRDSVRYKFKLTLYQTAILNGHAWALEPLRKAGADINMETQSLTGQPGYVLSTPALAIASLPDAERVYQQEGWTLPEYLQDSWRAIASKGYTQIAADWFSEHATPDNETINADWCARILDGIAHEKDPNHPLLKMALANPLMQKHLQGSPKSFVSTVSAAIASNHVALLNTLDSHSVPLDDVSYMKSGVSYNALSWAIYTLADDAFDYLLTHDVPLRFRKHTNPCNGADMLSVLRQRVKDVGVSAEDTNAQTAYRNLIRKALTMGADTKQAFNPGTLLHVNSMWARDVENEILIEEGFSIDAPNNEGESVAELAERYENAGSYGFYNDYRKAYTALWQRFSNEAKLWNPFTGSTPSRSQKLSDHPLGLLHAFSAIGKLKDAMHPKFWQGHMDVRAEIMEELYPYQQRILARDYATSVAQSADTPKEFSSWSARIVTDHTQDAFRGRA